MLSNGKDLDGRTLTLDADISEFVRKVGMEVTAKVYEEILKSHIENSKKHGLIIKKHPSITFNTIFGPIVLGSPYMWNEFGHSKPLAEEMGITHNGRTITVERAMSDFVGVKSHSRGRPDALKDIHKYTLSPSTATRVTKGIAAEAQNFDEHKLNEAAEKYGENENDSQNSESFIVELDGCENRTATLIPSETADTSPVLNLPTGP